MKSLHTFGLSALLLGAAALTTPVLAADAGAPASAPAAQSDSSTASQSANGDSSANSSVNGQVASNASANGDSSSANSNSANGTSPANTQMAMNGDSASTLSSIPDNSHKFSRSKLNADNQSEDQTTRDLNQQESKLTNNAGNAQ